MCVITSVIRYERAETVQKPMSSVTTLLNHIRGNHGGDGGSGDIYLHFKKGKGGGSRGYQ